MNWKWVALASVVAILLWLFSAQWWYDIHDIHDTVVLHLDKIIVTPSDTH